MATQKRELREQLLGKRSQIPGDEYLEKSELIVHSLKQEFDFNKVQTVHSYISMNHRNEVNTQPFIRDMLHENENIVVVPVMESSGDLRHVRLESFDDLRPNEWGVMEPIRGDELPTEDLDLVIVPMVGGDEKCNRLGYGKGYYDRFLNDIFCPAIGLSFDCCIVPQVPIDPTDIPLTMIITEKRVIR